MIYKDWRDYMDFSHSKQEKDFIQHVKQVLDESIKTKRDAWRAENTTPIEMFKLLGQNGLLGFSEVDGEFHPIPWQYNIHFYKEMAQLSGGLAIAAFAHSQLGVQALHYFGNEDQKSKYLVPGAKGEIILAFANTEPEAGSDAASISLVAKKHKNGFIINGSKAYITNGDIADYIILTAVTHPDEQKKHKRISMFIVDGNTSGLSRMRLDKYGWAPSHLSTLKFEDVTVSTENLIGETAKGFYQTMQVFNTSRIGIAALAFGTALGSYKLAYEHASKRNAFGKTLFEHESKRNEFADNITSLEAGWLLVQKAAFLKDSGEEFRFNSSIAKLFSTEKGLKITQWATEIFGARGILMSNRVSDYPQDAMVALIGEGPPEVQKKIVSEHINEILESFS
jgi:alkylation response protein AidB-like acyl-CoA dehydrogenase